LSVVVAINVHPSRERWKARGRVALAARQATPNCPFGVTLDVHAPDESLEMGTTWRSLERSLRSCWRLEAERWARHLTWRLVFAWRRGEVVIPDDRLNLG